MNEYRLSAIGVKMGSQGIVCLWEMKLKVNWEELTKRIAVKENYVAVNEVRADTSWQERGLNQWVLIRNTAFCLALCCLLTFKYVSPLKITGTQYVPPNLTFRNTVLYTHSLFIFHTISAQQRFLSLKRIKWCCSVRDQNFYVSFSRLRTLKS